MFVKICGLSEPVTVEAALDAGADAVGFVFAPGSPRTIDPSVARELIRGVPETVLTVGVFRKQPIDEVLRMATEAGVNTVQLHGGETLADFERVREAGFGTIRALSIDEYLREVERDPVGIRAHRLLIDAPMPGAGEVFDTTELQAHPPQDGWLLAGGLNPNNVAEVIRAARPGGVDVSSGVEAVRGQKDAALIRAFVAAARAAI
ncbi:N-(5'-phosphoribosyl)anthranilate isomerase [Leifsonia kafniensis]|uniref:N-(5'-phosphoribosyl)anthranilate isomerase n=1 Tax=Leifsonia kafniensis TaxID=475957 RepID=A0ABP7KNY7_9MICO